MTYNGKTYNSNVLNQNGYIIMLPNVGEAADLRQVNNPINPYAESASPLFPLGTKLIQGERVWRYCKTGGTGLNRGSAIQAAAPVHADIFPDLAIGAVAAIGATSVEVTSTANIDVAPWSTKDGGAEGYIVFQDLTGESQMYKIKGHDAFSTTDDATVFLYDGLVVAIDATTQCGLLENPYSNVIATTAVITGVFIGTSLIDTTTLYYSWIQTGGPAVGIPKVAIPVGDPVVVGTTAAKFDVANAFTTETVVGWAMSLATADTEAFAVFLIGDR